MTFILSDKIEWDNEHRKETGYAKLPLNAVRAFIRLIKDGSANTVLNRIDEFAGKELTK